MDEALLIFYLRPARQRARATATAEALCLLRDLSATAPAGGPLSEQGGLFWVALPAHALERARARLPLLGYTYAVDLAEPAQEHEAGEQPGARNRLVRWRRRLYRLFRHYEEDPERLRESAPDRRTFAFETEAGEVRAIRGYRGDSGSLSRRGLPVPDARMLVNLAFVGAGAAFRDPFAGVGGIVLEALAHAYGVLSCDRDTALRHGLSSLGATHLVADARRLPLGAVTVDTIATEPPYERGAEDPVVASFVEMHRVLKDGGRLAMLCAAWQVEGLRQRAASIGLISYHEAPIDRKGTECAVLAWEKR